MHFCWLAEAPNYPGVYAVGVSLGNPPHTVATANPALARRFSDRAEAAGWCACNPIPYFIPVEVPFADRERQNVEVSEGA